MESRLLFATDKVYIHKVRWQLPDEDSVSEWRYLDPNNFTEVFLLNMVAAWVNAEFVYLVRNRKESKKINTASLFAELKVLYGSTRFRVWDMDFKCVIDFDLEVYRLGCV